MTISLTVVRAAIVRRAGRTDVCYLTLDQETTVAAFGADSRYVAPGGLSLKFEAPEGEGERAMMTLGVDNFKLIEA
jgi:hypothetical protein